MQITKPTTNTRNQTFGSPSNSENNGTTYPARANVFFDTRLCNIKTRNFRKHEKNLLFLEKNTIVWHISEKFGIYRLPFFFFIGTCVFFFTETFENVNNENFLNIGNMDTYMDFRLGKYSPEIFCTVLYAWWKEGGSVIVAIE